MIINNETLKYCIVTHESLTETDNADSCGFYQWKNVFNGKIIQARIFPAEVKDYDPDIIHIRLTNQDMSLPVLIRNKIGKHTRAKIVLTIDIQKKYWELHNLKIDKIKCAMDNADFIFAVEHQIVSDLEEISDKLVYEIPHPADIQKFYNARNGFTENKFLFLESKPDLTEMQLKRILSKLSGLKLVIPEINRVRQISSSMNETGRKLSCNDRELRSKIAENEYIIVPRYCADYEKIIVYAAATGCIVIADSSFESARRCYPFTTIESSDIQKIADLLFWIANDKNVYDFVRNNAMHKVEYYNWGNLRKKFLDNVYTLSGDGRFNYNYLPKVNKSKLTIFAEEILHIYGKKTIRYDPDELAVVCLVRNGREYLNTFLDHYRLMGIKCFIFIDNGSVDGTDALLKQQSDVILYKTSLPHKNFENEIRRTIIEEHCRNRWCLCVDIDELFDYPYSGKLSIAEFLFYLNKRKFTAVLAYMMDMFSKKLKFGSEEHNLNLKEKYCYYDLSGIKRTGYFSDNKNFYNYNRLSDSKMQLYYGGIRQKKFGNINGRYLLTKHPLMFVDHKMEPVTDPHYCNKAYIADVNAVLMHFKFIESFNEKVRKSVNEKNYMYFADCEYNAYYKAIKGRKEISFYSFKAEKFNMDNLVNHKFLRVSEEFKRFTNILITR